MSKNKEVAKIAKENSVKPVETKKKKNILAIIWNFITGVFVLAVLLVTLFVVVQHPQIKEYYEDLVSGKEKQEIARLNSEMDMLKKAVETNSLSKAQLYEISDSIYALREKYKALEENSSNAVKAKADLNLVLGVINRLDNIDSRVSEVAKVSDRGALIALAVALVKDAWERGSDFTYEMSVLDQLTTDELKIRPYIEVLNKHVRSASYNEAMLAADFEKINNMSFPDETEADIEEGDWKAKFNKKFGKLLTIKIKKQAEEVEEINLDKVLMLIKSGEFTRAVEELSREKYLYIVESNPDLKEWLQTASARIEFASALSKISAYSLAVMKVNEFKR